MNTSQGLSISSLLFIVACSSIDSTPPPTPTALAEQKGYTLAAPADKIINYKLDGWNYINPKAIIIHAGPNQDYLVTLQTRCHELSSREVIGTTATGSAMRARFDAIVVTESGTSLNAMNTRKCYIDQIYRVEKNNDSK